MKKKPPDVFCKIGILKNSAIFTGKHLRQGLFFNKESLLKKRTLLRIPFFVDHVRWLLLPIKKKCNLEEKLLNSKLFKLKYLEL